MTLEQINTLEQIKAALMDATDNGTLDELTAIIHPDIINRFCDAVDSALDLEARTRAA